MQKPEWWSDPDAQEVVQLLRWFVQKVSGQEGKKILPKKLTQDKFPVYFDFSNSDGRIYIAEIFQELADKSILSLHKDKNRDIVKVVFNPSAEFILRDWLGMPRVSLRDQAWQQAIANSTEDFIKSYSEILLALGCLGIFDPVDLLLALSRLNLLIPALIAEKKNIPGAS
jgi:hypothetical protein